MDPLQIDRVVALTRQFSNRRLLVVGDVMIDRYIFGRVERLNPEAPVPILHAKSDQRATGGAGNTAKNAAALGANATLISVTGIGPGRESVEEAARAEGYRAILIGDPDRPTIEKTRFIVGSQQMLRVDYEETHDISGRVETEVVAAIKEAAQQTDAIVVSDYAKGFLTEAVAKAVLEASRCNRLPVMADVKPSRIGYFKGVTYISPNRKEAHEYLGLNQHLQGGKSREELAFRLRETFNTNVFITLSEDGMYVLSLGAGEGVHVPQLHQVAVADTSGCGDTAAVAITLAKLCGASDSEAAQIGNAAGAVIATKIGAVALSQQELTDALVHIREWTHAARKSSGIS